VDAFSYLAKYDRNKKLSLETPGPLSDTKPVDTTAARAIIQKALDEGRAMLSDIESKSVLDAYNIPVNRTIEADSLVQAHTAANKLGYPVAIKINSPQISHKTDVGGVRIGVMDADGVTSAWGEIMQTVEIAMPDAKILGVTVESMVTLPAARELLVGTSRDPVFGPTILFGAGGTMVEVLRDSAVSLPPLNTVLANRLISRTKVSRLLEIFRDKPAADHDAVINVLLRVSDLVCEIPEIEELDINPLFAGPSGVISIDARIRIKPLPNTKGRYNHMAIQP
jgi:acetyltransferase